jgi:hypothetical protein
VKPNAPTPNALVRWLTFGHRLDQPAEGHHGHPWYKVLWLTGVDYFSTLGYQPGIALIAAAALAPFATVLLVLLTLFGAVPIYSAVAKRSFAGQGSIAMLESALEGWRGKLLVLILLGFACTDFIITITLSSADAAEHMVHNPFLEPILHGQQVWVTLALITLLAAVFLRGFREAIGVAMAVALPYIFLNFIVLGYALYEALTHPEVFTRWENAVNARGDPTTILLICALVFPKLALGMSGFETGVSVMPQISGGEEDKQASEYPVGRVRATRKLLLSAALLMCTLLLLSSFVTTLLIDPADYSKGGKAAGRAIAFIAHKYLGSTFGSIYDFSTIAILWFAGASAMAGMLNLIPRYLPRFGMAPQWIAFQRPLVLVLYLVSVIVTIIFKADVEAQGGAYATGVLVLMLSACLAVALEATRERRWLRIIYFWLVVAVFAFTLVDNVIARTDGVIIAMFFIATIMLLGAWSRAWRSIELRVSDLTFTDDSSHALWKEMIGKRVHAAPLRTGSARSRKRKAEEIRKFYRAAVGPLAFLHVNLVDNRSDFLSPLKVTVKKEGENYVVEVFGAVAIANTIAYISELIDPISLFLGLTRQNLMTQSIKYLVWGEGETGLMVYMILLRYWGAKTGEEHVRPNIFIMSTST